MSIFKKHPHLQIIQKIARKNKVSTYLVGGFLRDHLLGRDKMDFDFAVEKKAMSFAKAFAKEIKGAFVLLDEDRGCARIAKKTDQGLLTFDFADFRAKTFRGDLDRRDFTINTLSVNVLKIKENFQIKKLVVDHQSGLEDLQHKRIRMVSPTAFQEDPLRMMRAYSLMADLGFKIEKSTRQQIKNDRDLIKNVSYERIREELFKVLKSDKAGQVLKAMARIGLLERIIPQIRVMFDCKQGTYHHLDVWPHSLESVVQLDRLVRQMRKDADMSDYLNQPIAGMRTRLSVLRLATLLHDIGKPDTRRKEKDRLSFHGHEGVGKNIARHIAKLLKLSTRERHMVCDLIQFHLRPGYLSNFKKPSGRMVYRFFRDTQDEAVSTLLLSLADQRATRGPLTTEKDRQHHEDICLGLILQYFAKKKEKPFVRLINGDDLKKYLHLNPSPLIGKILLEVEEQQNLGKIKTKKEALVLARKIMEK